MQKLNRSRIVVLAMKGARLPGCRGIEVLPYALYTPRIDRMLVIAV